MTSFVFFQSYHYWINRLLASVQPSANSFRHGLGSVMVQSTHYNNYNLPCGWRHAYLTVLSVDLTCTLLNEVVMELVLLYVTLFQFVSSPLICCYVFFQCHFRPSSLLKFINEWTFTACTTVEHASRDMILKTRVVEHEVQWVGHVFFLFQETIITGFHKGNLSCDKSIFSVKKVKIRWSDTIRRANRKKHQL